MADVTTDFIAIAGLSGAGRSQAADALEDLGWFVIDNLPPLLIDKVADLADAPGTGIERVGLVVGTGPYHEELLPAIRALRGRASARVRILFLTASTEALVARYESTRRKHPLAEGRSLKEAIEHERGVLEPVKAEADLVIDTSDYNVHDLRRRMVDEFGEDLPGGGMRAGVVSFGYKHGLPIDVDMVFDLRFLPNPHWVDELRPLSGLDEAVRRYVLGQPEAAAFLERLDGLLDVMMPAFVHEGKSYLTLAVGCTGGRHRSVVVAEEIARLLRRRGFDPIVRHRDVGKADGGAYPGEVPSQ